jgi:hypothetical protein
MLVEIKFAQATTHKNTVCALQAIVLAMATITLGCSVPRRAPNAASDVIDVPVRFIGASGDAMPEAERPDKWAAALGVVPGGIFGVGRYQRPPEDAYGNASNVPVNLSQLRILLDQQSAMISTASVGWKVVPAETRFARLATTISNAGTDKGPLLVGFRDSVSKKSIVLVFFDRPCRLIGTAENHTLSGEIIKNTIDVAVKKAGLNWLEVTEEGTSTHITNATGVASSNLLFVVSVPKR